MKKLEDELFKLKEEMRELKNNILCENTNQEKYYQQILEKQFPGSGHRRLTTKAGSTIITDITSPDDWNPDEHDGMPSFHMEIKNISGYKEIVTQLSMAQAVLPRDLNIGVIFTHPSHKKLTDIFETLHTNKMELCYFDHHDMLWWFDGDKQREFKDLYKKDIENDIYKAFVNEQIECGDGKKEEFRTKITEIYDALDRWSIKNGLPSVKRDDGGFEKNLKQKLETAFEGKAKSKLTRVKKYGGDPTRVFQGVKLK